jgi:hypothetical protein
LRKSGSQKIITGGRVGSPHRHMANEVIEEKWVPEKFTGGRAGSPRRRLVNEVIEEKWVLEK